MSSENPKIRSTPFWTRSEFLAVIAVAIALRVWNISWGLPELYEEAMPLRIAWKFWNWGASGLNFNPDFFIYPAFTFYLHFLVQLVQYFIGYLLGSYANLAAFYQAFAVDPSAFVILARVVTSAFDVGTAVVSYKLASCFFDKNSGLVAASLVAINPLHIKEAHLINVDTPLTFFVILTMYFIYRLYVEKETKWYLLAGIGTGLAAATKYNGGLLVPILIVVHMLKAGSLSAALRSLTSRVMWLAILLALVVFLAFNPYILLQPQQFIDEFSGVRTHMEMGHLGINAETSTLEYYFLRTLPENLGWPTLILTILSSIYLLFEREKMSFALLAFPLFYIGTICTWVARFDRYIFPAVPSLLIIAAVGFFKLRDKLIISRKGLQAKSFVFSKPTRLGLTFVILAALFLPQVLATIRYEHSASLRDTRDVARTWLNTHLAPGSSVATGPFGIDFSNSRLIMMPIPFNAGETERTIPFYDVQWYEDLDLVITSDYDFGRYKQEPQRFQDILQFYDSLSIHWKLLSEITPGDTLTGPSFWFYQPPASAKIRFNGEKIEKLMSTADSMQTVNFFGKLALILSAKGKLEKSEQLLHKIVLVAPDNAIAHKELASVDARMLKYTEAQAEIEKCLEIDPEDPEALALQGNILIQLNRLDEAENRLQEALSINRQIESAYIDLNIIYASRKDKQKMIDILSQYLKILPPGGNKARIVEDQLRQLRGPS